MRRLRDFLANALALAARCGDHAFLAMCVQVDELRDQVDALQHTQQQQQQGQGPHQHQHQVVTVVEVAPWWHRLLPRWRSRRKEHEDAQPGSGGAAREEEEEEKERVGDAAEAPPATEDSTPAAAEPEVAGWAQSLNDIPALLLRAGGVLMDVGGAVGVESPGEEHEQQQQQRSEEEAGLGEEERERRRAARLTQGLSERDASARLALRLGLPALVAAAPATAPPDASSGGGGGPPSPSGPAEQGLAAPAHGDEEEDKGDEQQCGGRGTAASSSSHRRSGALEAHAQWQKVAATCEQQVCWRASGGGGCVPCAGTPGMQMTPRLALRAQGVRRLKPRPLRRQRGAMGDCAQIALLVARHAMEMHYLFESEAQLSHWRRYAARELVFETGWGAPPWLARWAGLEGVEEGRRGVGTAQEGGPGPEGGGGGRQELSVRVRVWWPLWEAGEAEERAAESQSTWDAVWHAVGVDQ